MNDVEATRQQSGDFGSRHYRKLKPRAEVQSVRISIAGEPPSSLQRPYLSRSQGSPLSNEDGSGRIREKETNGSGALSILSPLGSVASKRDKLKNAFSGLSDLSTGSIHVNSTSFTRRLLHRVVFAPVGILVFLRLFPLGSWILPVLVIFCPAGNSLCGDPTFTGIYSTNQMFSVVALTFFALALAFILFKCSVYWVPVIAGISGRKTFMRVSSMIRGAFTTVQPLENPYIAPIHISRPFAFLMYILLSVPLLVWSELLLLVHSPFRLAPTLFLAEFEILRFTILQSGIAVVSLACGALAIHANRSISPIAVVLVVISGLSLLINLAFLRIYGLDDRSSLLAALVSNCYISRPPSDEKAPDNEVSMEEDLTVSESAGEFPFYRTLRYRSQVDLRPYKFLKPFQIIQLVNNLKVNPTLNRLIFSGNLNLHAASGHLIARHLKSRPETALEYINEFSLKEIITSNCIIISPDTDRVKSLHSPEEPDVGPWENNNVRWKDGLPWKGGESKVEKLSPFVTGIILSLIDHSKLEELDLASNELSDKVSRDIAQLVLRAPNLCILELGNNNFSPEGYKRIIGCISQNSQISAVRLSTVPIQLNSIRTHRILDLSLPALYNSAVSRCVDSLFVACAQKSHLAPSFTQQPLKLQKMDELNKYLEQINEVVSIDFREVGRNLFRSVTPHVAKLCVARVAHRLAKYILPDPGDQLDLNREKCIDGSISMETDITQNRLYMSFLSDADTLLISSIIDIHNNEIEEFDCRGMPLSVKQLSILLRALVGKYRLRSLNFGFCGIADPLSFPELMNFLKNCSETVTEINLKGNPAYSGQKEKIWALYDTFPRISKPRIIVDDF